jgi:hypothetical protein
MNECPSADQLRMGPLAFVVFQDLLGNELQRNEIATDYFYLPDKRRLIR